jgi:ABC-type sugar transport system, periplasmic component
MKKKLLVLMTLVLTIALIFSSTLSVFAFSSKLTIVSKDVTIAVGQKFNLKAKLISGTGKFTYISSNKKVANVDANGNVTAIARGSAVITVTNTKDKSTEKCKVTVPVLKKVTLKWYLPWMAVQKDQDLVFAAANKITIAKINTEVKWTPISFGEYANKLQILQASGDQYDVCFTSNWLNNYLQGVAKGAYLALDSLLIKYAPSYYQSASQGFWNAAKVNGKIYGALIQQIYARNSNLNVIDSFNKNVPFNVNINPNTFKLTDLDPWFAKVSKEYPDKMATQELGDITDLASYFRLDYIAGANIPGAIRYTDKTLKVINQYDSPEFMEFVKTQDNWIKKGYAKPKENTTDSIKGGVVASQIGGTKKPGGEADAKASTGFSTTLNAISPSFVSTGSIQATLNGVSRTSKNPERVMMLFELLNTDVNLYNTILFGIKDKHFTLSGKRMTPIKDSGYSGATYGFFFMNVFNTYIQPGQDDNVYIDTRAMNEAAQVSPAIGFTFDMESVKAAVANCQAVVTKYMAMIKMGVYEKDLTTTLADFSSELKKAGAGTIVAEMQKQIDAWKAKNK